MANKKPKKSLIEIKTGKPKAVKIYTSNTIEESIENNLARLKSNLNGFDVDDFPRGSISQKIVNLIEPLDYFLERKESKTERTENDIALCLLHLKKLGMVINEFTKFTPTKNTFCTLLATSTAVFSLWLNENNTKGMECQLVMDYLQEGIMQGMANGDIAPIQGTFICKANLGMKENEQPNQVINILNTNKSTEEIMEEWATRKKLMGN
jgi:hypothetical protein